jgi:tetratricopeptide (TPR) repeat protein
MKCRGPYLLIFAVAFSLFSATLAFGYSLAETNALEHRKDWNGLLKYAQAWTQAEPNNPNAWGVLSVAYFFGLDRPDLALDPTKRGISLAPKEPGAWTALGSIYMKLKHYSDAVDAFTHAVDLAPHNGNFWNNLASAYSEEKNYMMDLQTLEKQAQTAGPYQNDDLWYNLGNGLSTVAASTRNGATSGRSPDEVLREAVSAYQQCLRLNPRYAKAWTNLGVAEEALGATQNALNDYQRAASLGDSFGRKNYADLQNAIAAANARAATGSVAGSNVPWVDAKQRAQWDWDHDLSKQVSYARPQ